MTLEQIENTYKEFIQEVKNGEQWEESGTFIHDVLSFYNIKIPQAIYKCDIVKSDGTIKGHITSLKQFDSVFNAIKKLKNVNITM